MQLVGWPGLRRNALLMSGAIIASIFLAASSAWADGKGPGLTIYVDDDAPSSPKGDGLTWQTAFRYLQDALHFAAEPDSGVTEIRVAQGVYKPDQGAKVTPGDVLASFVTPSGITLRGGYAGLVGDDPDAKDFEKFETVLSGDLLGNDGPPGSFENYADNSRLVVRVISDPQATVEGFTVTAGTAGPNYFVGTSTSQIGSAMRCEGGSPHIIACRFQYNWAGEVAGAAMFGCKAAVVTNCHFAKNLGPLGCCGGAGLTANANIGQHGGTLTVTGCVFEQNQGDAGCGLYSHGLDLVEVSDCTFIGNVGDLDGAAIYVDYSPADDKLIVRRSHFEDNVASEYGGAVFARVADFFDCDFVGNMAGASGGAIQQGLIFPGECKVVDCRFTQNVTFFSVGSAISARFEGESGILNCDFYGNSASVFNGPGGALSVAGGAAPVINCAFAGNTSPHGAGAAWVNINATGTFINCTVANNSSGAGSGAVAAFGVAELVNTIVWGNDGAQLQGNITASYSCVQNGWPGEGNIAADPMFIDAIGPDGIAGTEDDDLRLRPASPCIDAGYNSALPADDFDLDGDGDTDEQLPLDLDGNTRVAPRWPNLPLPHVVDMGAFEFQPPRLGDLNIDGLVNHLDLMLLVDAWGGCAAPREQDCPPDLAPPGGDGIVNVDDLLILFANWG